MTDTFALVALVDSSGTKGKKCGHWHHCGRIMKSQQIAGDPGKAPIPKGVTPPSFLLRERERAMR